QRLAGLRIYEKGRQLTRLLTGLSQVARLDEIRTAPRDEPVDLTALLVELVAEAERHYPDLAIEIELQVPEASARGNAFWLRTACRSKARATPPPVPPPPSKSRGRERQWPPLRRLRSRAPSRTAPRRCSRRGRWNSWRDCSGSSVLGGWSCWHCATNASGGSMKARCRSSFLRAPVATRNGRSPGRPKTSRIGGSRSPVRPTARC